MSRISGKIPLPIRILLLAIVIAIIILPVVFQHPVDCNLETSTPRPIVQSTISITPLWELNGVHLENFEQALPMVSTQGRLIAARNSCNEVTALNLLSGTVVWKTEQDNPEQKRFQAINYPSNLTLDDVRQQIYVSGLDEIRAISIADGSPIWRNVTDEFSRNSHRVVIQADGQLTVEASHHWYMDALSGNLSETPIHYELTNSAFTPTVDLEAREVLSKLTGYRVISNAIHKNGIIYALDSNAKLHLLNSENSEEIGAIQFEQPKPSKLLYAPGAIGGSWIAVEGNIVAIYFQDTDTLSAYKTDSETSPVSGANSTAPVQ